MKLKKFVNELEKICEMVKLLFSMVKVLFGPRLCCLNPYNGIFEPKSVAFNQ